MSSGNFLLEKSSNWISEHGTECHQNRTSRYFSIQQTFGTHRCKPPYQQRRICLPHRRNRQRQIKPVESPVCRPRSEEHTSELQSRMRISYAVLCLEKKKK